MNQQMRTGMDAVSQIGDRRGTLERCREGKKEAVHVRIVFHRETSFLKRRKSIVSRECMALGLGNLGIGGGVRPEIMVERV